MSKPVSDWHQSSLQGLIPGISRIDIRDVCVSLYYYFHHKTSILQNRQCSELFQKVHGTKSCLMMINRKITSDALKKGSTSCIWKGKKFMLLPNTKFLVSITFLLLRFCMTSWTSCNLPILKAKGNVASCSQRGNPPPPSSTMPHKNIRSQIKTEWLESSKTTSFASVHLLLKIAFNLL